MNNVTFEWSLRECLKSSKEICNPSPTHRIPQDCSAAECEIVKGNEWKKLVGGVSSLARLINDTRPSGDGGGGDGILYNTALPCPCIIIAEHSPHPLPAQLRPPPLQSCCKAFYAQWALDCNAFFYCIVRNFFCSARRWNSLDQYPRPPFVPFTCCSCNVNFCMRLLLSTIRERETKKPTNVANFPAVFF